MNIDTGKKSNGQTPFQENMDSFMEKLANAKMDFESLAENIPQGLARCKIICDLEGTPIDYRIIRANKAYEKHTGINREFAQGKTIIEIYPDIEKSWIETYGRVAKTLKTETIEGYNHNTKRHYRSTAYSDTPGEFMMLFEDTTHQIELEKAYELVFKSTKFNADILNNMQEGFKHCKVICDKENNPIDFKIISINEAYEKQTGIKRIDIEGKTMLDVFPDMNLEKLKGFCQVGITGESNTFIDPCSFTGKIFDISAFSPRSMEFILIIRDITEKEKARIKLEEAYKKVEESEKLKSAFLANMSHEIRTPLNAILGFAELLGEQETETEDKTKCLENIKASGHRLLAIVSDVLEISKLEANQHKLNFATHNLNEIITRLLEQFRVINTNTALKIECAKELSDSKAEIETDATRLEQILSNLLENAIKHTSSGVVRFGYQIKGSFLEFFVTDTGKGIKKEDQTTIFKRFGQVDDKAEITKGTGLGLPIAAGFTQLFGGKIWVDSEPNKGSTFYFTIPFKPQSERAELLKKPTILVGEDEDANFLLLEMWLKKHCHLIRAYDGQETLSQLENNPKIDLVLMDIRMPYLNGIEATREIRKTNSKTPIIAQTAFIMDDERSEILKAGANEVLSKPIRREEFKKLLTKYIPHLKFA